MDLSIGVNTTPYSVVTSNVFASNLQNKRGKDTVNIKNDFKIFFEKEKRTIFDFFLNF